MHDTTFLKISGHLGSRVRCFDRYMMESRFSEASMKKHRSETQSPSPMRETRYAMKEAMQMQLADLEKMVKARETGGLCTASRPLTKH